MGILWRQSIKALLLPFWDPALFVLKHKMGAADQNLFSVDGTGDPMCHQIFHFGMILFMSQAAAPRFRYNGVCHRMRKMFLQAGGQPQHFLFIFAAERNHLRHPRAGVSQRAGFVKDNRIRGGDRLQKFTPFDSNIGSSGLPHRRKDRQRHGQFQRARKIHHQHRQRPGHIPGEGKAQDTSRKGVGNQPVGKAGRFAFGIRLHLFRLLDHVDDLVVTALTGNLLYFKNTFSFFHNGSGINCPAGMFGYRNGLPCERSLIDGNFPFQYQAVHGNDPAGPHHYRVPGLDL